MNEPRSAELLANLIARKNEQNASNPDARAKEWRTRTLNKLQELNLQGVEFMTMDDVCRSKFIGSFSGIRGTGPRYFQEMLAILEEEGYKPEWSGYNLSQSGLASARYAEIKRRKIADTLSTPAQREELANVCIKLEAQLAEIQQELRRIRSQL